MNTFVLLLASIALVGAKGVGEFPNCWCGMFIEMDDEVHMVYHLESITVDSCDDVSICKTTCANEFNVFTSGGDLNHLLANGYSVGQEICLKMVEHHGIHNVYHAKVYGYANACNGPWAYDGVSSTNALCCHEGFYKACD
ncbi:uncharacterized protein LOC121862293 [Homarus americanus]|uniref:Uncharacterized protein n=1 Tax=Homarus americanus TaxID=6706 RepID=A0A8J5TV58_HOMAM|nr:uncharacterized protein LOC121862293 [Homarus americanus]KAG7177692.1 hypothetical protein Hamer_G008356 [Homarus americanus]